MKEYTIEYESQEHGNGTKVFMFKNEAVFQEILVELENQLGHTVDRISNIVFGGE